MKKLNKGALFLALVAVMIVGCEKEEGSTQNPIQQALVVKDTGVVYETQVDC